MKSTVVVGHGRSPEGRAWGRSIDGADRVIRMWNWHWQMPTDYGTRYDVGVLEAHAKIMRQWRQCNSHTPRDRWLVSVLGKNRVARNLSFPRPFETVHQRRWLDDSMIIAHPPTGFWEMTRGGVAACWAIETSRRGDVVVLIGFDNVRLGVNMQTDAAFSPAYQGSAGFWGVHDYTPGLSAEGNMDLRAEYAMYRRLADIHGVTVAFAQDVWP